MPNARNAKIAGPQQLTYKGQDMGHTLEGVALTNERDFKDVIVDQYGETPVDKVLTGNRLMLKFKMAESDWEKWNIAIPETSSQKVGANGRVDFGSDAGASLWDEAGLLVMHPMKLPSSNKEFDVNIYKAVSAEGVEVPYKIDDQKVIEVTMHALVDESYGPGRRLGHMGPADIS